MKSKTVSSLVVELPKSNLPASAARNGGAYTFFISGPEPRQSEEWVHDGRAMVLSTGGNAAVHISKGRFAYSTDCWALVTDEKVVNIEFLYQWLLSMRDYIDTFGFEGSGLRHLRKDFVRNLIIDLPPFVEQEKIAEVLSTADQAIEQTESLIAKQQRIKTGLMQDFLSRGIDENGNIRSEETHEFKDSPLGRIPVEWEVKSINQLATHVGSGITPRGGEDVYLHEGNILFIRSQNVHFEGLMHNDIRYIPPQIHSLMRRSEVFANDVLLNITGASIGRCCVMPILESKANVNQHVCIIRPDNTLKQDSILLATLLESSYGQRQIAQFNAGGNREGLNYQQVKNLIFPWPQLGERKKLAELVTLQKKATTLSVKKLNKLRSLKRGLMQDLLTGKVRVTPLLEETEEVGS